LTQGIAFPRWRLRNLLHPFKLNAYLGLNPPKLYAREILYVALCSLAIKSCDMEEMPQASPTERRQPTNHQLFPGYRQDG
jgi:hypothetical protein